MNRNGNGKRSMRTDKIRQHVLTNIAYPFILWRCLKLGTAYRLAAGTASVSARGFVYGTSANPTTADGIVTVALGTGTGDISATLTSLMAGTTYHVRAYATSSAGTAYGEDRTFITQSGGRGFPIGVGLSVLVVLGFCLLLLTLKRKRV